MSKPLIIIADTDELYLTNLERKFLEEFDDQIDLEIISDADYFEKRFEKKKSNECNIALFYSAGNDVRSERNQQCCFRHERNGFLSG